jgi:DNA modification methylase
MKIKLIHGDCLEEMKRLPDKSIDLFLCDLPYGCLSSSTKTERKRFINGTDTGTTLNTQLAGCAWDIKIDLDAFWEQVERLMKDDHTPIIHFCNTKFGVDLIISKPSWFRYDLVWNKTNGVGFLSANKMPLRSHENIYVFAKKGARYNRVDIEGDFPRSVKEGHKRSSSQSVYGNDYVDVSHDNTGKRCVKSVVTIANKKGKGKHPTQKPDDLYAWLIERYSKPGDTILDPTAGSFASCFAAKELGRQSIGIEMNDTFYQKALNLTKE